MPTVFIFKQIHGYDELDKVVAPATCEADIPTEYMADYLAVSDSQYTLAKIIAANPTIPVVQENDSEFKLYDQSKEAELEAKYLFPNGLPNSYTDLNFLQKRFLIRFPAGYLSVLNKTIQKLNGDDLTYKNHPEISERLNHLTPSSDEYLQELAKDFQIREHLAIKNVLQISEKTQSPFVIYIIGELHYFHDLQECFPTTTFIDISTSDFFENPTHLAKWLKLKDARPPVNCERLEQGFTPLITPPKEAKAAASMITSSKSSTNTADLVGATAIGLLFVGLTLFSCCQKNKPSKSAKTRPMIPHRKKLQ